MLISYKNTQICWKIHILDFNKKKSKIHKIRRSLSPARRPSEAKQSPRQSPKHSPRDFPPKLSPRKTPKPEISVSAISSEPISSEIPLKEDLVSENLKVEIPKSEVSKSPKSPREIPRKSSPRPELCISPEFPQNQILSMKVLEFSISKVLDLIFRI